MEIASRIPESFPAYEDVEYYLSPLTTFNAPMEADGGPPPVYEVDARQPCLASIAALYKRHFRLDWESVLLNMRQMVWEGAAVRRLCEASDSVPQLVCLFLIDLN